MKRMEQSAHAREARLYGRLRREREEQGFTQEHMAKLLGYRSRNTYSMKERGERRFTVEEALLIARVLEQRVEELFHF